MRKQLAAAAEEYLAEAQAISRNRAAAARKLEKLAEAEINELAMKARFHVEVKTSAEEVNWSSSGIDSVAYLIATNPGEPLSPVEKIASGGELSRVMLALKATAESGHTHGNGNGKQGLYELLVSYRSGDVWAPKVEQTEALKVELEYFVECLLNNRTPLNDGAAGLRVVKLLEAADQSLLEKGKIIKL